MTTQRPVDADFLGLPRHDLADAALSAAVAAGASYADLRIHAITTEHVQLRDSELEAAVVNREIGLAVRVIVDGTWGFASHAELDPATAADTARRAVHVARTLAPLNAERIELAAEPVYSDVSWVSDYLIDPFTVASSDKIAVLGEYSGRLMAADGVDHASAGLHAVKEQTFYADTFGSSITQQRVRLLPTLEAVTVDAAAGTFETMRTLAPPTARGWEVVASDDVWNWSRTSSPSCRLCSPKCGHPPPYLAIAASATASEAAVTVGGGSARATVGSVTCGGTLRSAGTTARAVASDSATPVATASSRRHAGSSSATAATGPFVWAATRTARAGTSASGAPASVTTSRAHTARSDRATDAPAPGSIQSAAGPSHVRANDSAAGATTARRASSDHPPPGRAGIR